MRHLANKAEFLKDNEAFSQRKHSYMEHWRAAVMPVPKTSCIGLLEGRKDLIQGLLSNLSEHILETLQPQLGGMQPIVDLKAM